MNAVLSSTPSEQAYRPSIGLLERIGRDHALSVDELGFLGREAGVAAPLLWAAYEQHWRRFCGAKLDPQFWRLDHPARQTGSIAIAGNATVVIVGTGPSLRSMLPELRRIRTGVHIFTSPRGADALAEAGLVPDLVLIEHQTPLDAHFSARDLSHRATQALARVPLVAADARTPAALLAGISPERMFVPDPLPSWGLWPATAAALAIAAGARAVALVGIDLGTSRHPDPGQAPLRSLLAILATQPGVRCMNAGPGGARKRGWHPATLSALLEDHVVEPLVLTSRPWLTVDARHDAASACCRRLAPLVAATEATLAAATRVRDGDPSPAALADLHQGVAQLLASGSSTETRRDVQDGLGASYLPRFWRTPPDSTLGELLWRPAALAAHELIAQHRSLVRRLLQRGRTR